MKISLLSTAALCGLIALATPALAQQPSAAQRETDYLAEYRQNSDPYALENLANAREEQGDLSGAVATWNLMLKKHAAQESMAYSVSPTDKVKTMTYGELANWTLQRIARKRNLKNKPTSPARESAALQASLKFNRNPPVKYRRSTRSIDLDGDGIDEIIVEGKATEWPSDKMTSIGIYKWDGQSTYRPIWRAKQLPVDVVYGDYENDDMKDGFAEVTMIYTPNSDDIAALHFNGTSFMAYSSV